MKVGRHLVWLCGFEKVVKMRMKENSLLHFIIHEVLSFRFFFHNLQRRTLVGGCYKIAQRISQGWGWVGGGRGLEAKEKWLINLFHEILTNVKREHNQRLDLCEMLCEFFHG